MVVRNCMSHVFSDIGRIAVWHRHVEGGYVCMHVCTWFVCHIVIQIEIDRSRCYCETVVGRGYRRGVPMWVVRYWIGMKRRVMGGGCGPEVGGFCLFGSMNWVKYMILWGWMGGKGWDEASKRGR